MPSSAEESRCGFKLLPFAPASAPPAALSGDIVRLRRQLQVNFSLEANLAALAIPPPAAGPQRRHELWQQTCFELFVGPAEAGAYLEVNLCPSGHWNMYRFDSYRQGMREEPAVCLQSRVLRTAQGLTVQMKIDLVATGQAGEALRLSPCAVLLSTSGAPSYWAASHPADKPDFHDRRTWLFCN